MLGHQAHSQLDQQAEMLRQMLMSGMEQKSKSRKEWGAEPGAIDWVSLGLGTSGAMAPK
jgi:hypothetical protein